MEILEDVVVTTLFGPSSRKVMFNTEKQAKEVPKRKRRFKTSQWK